MRGVRHRGRRPETLAPRSRVGQAQPDRTTAEEAAMVQRRWRNLGPWQRIGLVAVAVGAAQLVLAVTAWSDLARRRPADVAGRKGVWAAVIAINWVGPLAYLRWGRRR